MNTIDPKKQEENELPDFVETDTKAADFGETEHPEVEQESFPANGNQTQTGAATNNSKLDIEPNEDGDDSLAKTDD
ncbi:hypothetical protein [Mucilaginibacter terrae]|uniref:Uncharacterized protein n=1 Tax=Mucilaginibacter terrae TaxID=1955052 RepID=A0ABU3H2I8_9SPHI|nr:hypothetical protein [Mucilaginibacter terrae]MDT3405472.1 hypothetical protein [Mucilaginibacter terrae]